MEIKFFVDVGVYCLPDNAYCAADDERRSPLDIDGCPIGCETCEGDCYYYHKAWYRKPTEYIKSGRYAPLVLQAAHGANEDIAGYLIMPIVKDLSYDDLERMWTLKEMERIPYCRTDFYGIRRYFFHIMDKKMKEIGK